MIDRIIDGKRIQQILNELTGRNAGVRIEHASGRVDVIARPDVIDATPEQIGLTMSELHKRSYDLLRTQGYSHERAVLLMGVRHVRQSHA